MMHVVCVCLTVYCIDNGDSVLALAGKDFETDVLKVTFKPGQSQSSVCVVIIDDDIKEESEKFRLVLSIPYSVQALGVWAAYPYFADVVILGKW